MVRLIFRGLPQLLSNASWSVIPTLTPFPFFSARIRLVSASATYLCISNKYLKDYASEVAWRTDTRKLSTGDKLKHVLRHALSVGMSLWWRGYTHGRHREDELLIEGDQAALGRGRQPGWVAKVPR